ncbi:MAG: hypothetical protein P8X85_19410 [Desulfobacterales bacterium]
MTAKKRQLKSVALSGCVLQIPRVIPPFGAIAGMRAVVFGKFQIARPGDGQVTGRGYRNKGLKSICLGIVQECPTTDLRNLRNSCDNQ